MNKKQLKRIIRKVIRESVSVMNSDTGEMLDLPDSYADRYEDWQVVSDEEFRSLDDEISFKSDDEDEYFDPSEALEELRALAQTIGNDWSMDNPDRSIENFAYDLANSIKWSVSEKTWDSASEIFDFNEEELIWALAEEM